MWFFAPPSAWQRLPLAVAVLVDVAGDRRRADEGDRRRRRDARAASRRRRLSPMTTLKTPSGRPASCSSSATQSEADGSFSDGLSTNVLPHAMRGRPHPHGHHRREVERRDAGDDAERLPDRVDVDAGRGLLGVLALEQRRDAAAVLDDLEPARHLAERVGEHLAVLAREDLGHLLAPRVQELADAEEELGAFRERRLAPGGEGVAAPPGRRRRPPRRVAKSTAPVWRPVAGL